MCKFYFIILMLLLPFSAMSVEYEKREIERCVSSAGGDPTKSAVCAGRRLTTAQINKCIEHDCFSGNSEIRKAFVSLYGVKLRQKKSCGDFEVNALDSSNTEFSTDKSWKLCSGYKVVFQKDGNLVVYNKNDKIIWSAGTHDKGADRLSLLPNGDLVIYKQVYPVWSSGTHGNPGSVLAVQEDGNLAIYNRYQKPIWATGTNEK